MGRKQERGADRNRGKDTMPRMPSNMEPMVTITPDAAVSWEGTQIPVSRRVPRLARAALGDNLNSMSSPRGVHNISVSSISKNVRL